MNLCFRLESCQGLNSKSVAEFVANFHILSRIRLEIFRGFASGLVCIGHEFNLRFISSLFWDSLRILRFIKITVSYEKQYTDNFHIKESKIEGFFSKSLYSIQLFFLIINGCCKYPHFLAGIKRYDVQQQRLKPNVKSPEPYQKASLLATVNSGIKKMDILPKFWSSDCLCPNGHLNITSRMSKSLLFITMLPSGKTFILVLGNALAETKWISLRRKTIKSSAEKWQRSWSS